MPDGEPLSVQRLPLGAFSTAQHPSLHAGRMHSGMFVGQSVQWLHVPASQGIPLDVDEAPLPLLEVEDSTPDDEDVESDAENPT